MEINFKIYKRTENDQRLTPVMVQVITADQKLVVPTEILVKETDWDDSRQKVKGTSFTTMDQNLYLLRLETKLLEYYNKSLRQQVEMDEAEIIKLLLEKEPDKTFKPDSTCPALSSQELISLQSMQVSDPELDKVRDVYLFICYSGIPYNYVNKLQRSQLWMINKQYCLRSTEETPFAFPPRLVRKALSLIRRWEGNYKPGTDQDLLPDISNLPVQEKLKELAELSMVQTPLCWDNALKTHWQTFIPSTSGKVGQPN